MSMSGRAVPIEPRVPSWNARRVLTDWWRVRIHLVEVVPDSGGRRVRAVVQLGALAPADVRVELLLTSRAREAPRDGGRPMWSTQSYDNGCYVFEATIARDDLAADGDWLVRVSPRAVLPLADLLHRVRLVMPHVPT